MIIKQIHANINDDEGRDQLIIDLSTNTYSKRIRIMRGEPEDNTLGRDLSFCWDISEMLKQAYEAGKKGEEMTFEKSETEDWL